MGDKSMPIMFVRQAAELDHAFERNGWSPEDVKKLSSGDTLARLLPVIRGYAEVMVREHLINLDDSPFVPSGLTVEEHMKGGECVWDPKKVKLYLSKRQRGGKSIEGNKLRTELAKKPVFNANLLDYLLAHPHLIPDEWKGKAVFFWGTIYRYANGNLVVRYLCWFDGQWLWNDGCLSHDWSGADPSAVRAS